MRKNCPIALLVLIFIAAAVSADEMSQSNYWKNELKAMKKISGDRARAQKLHDMAMVAHKKNNFPESERLWHLAAKADPGWADTYFNLACSTAMQGKRDIAVEYLEIALDLDRNTVLPWAKNDSDMTNLKDNKKYQRLVGISAIGGHWVNEIIGRQFEYSVKDSWNSEHRVIMLNSDGTMQVSGSSSDTYPCNYTFTDGKWSVKERWVEIVIFRKGGCADNPASLDKSQNFNITSKDEFMRIFSGGKGDGQNEQMK